MATLIENVMGSNGSEYSLYRRNDEYIIRVNGFELMTSYCHGSEEKLALSTWGNINSSDYPQILVGGLGMGFTLRKLLNLLPPDSSVTISEIEPAVIRWNRDYFREFNGDVLSDPRVDIYIGDVAEKLRGSEDYNAVVLDIDNGPHALSAEGNCWVYSEDGIASIYGSLRTGGVFTLWSAFMDEKFVKRLEDQDFRVVVEHVYSSRDSSSGEYLIFKCLKCTS